MDKKDWIVTIANTDCDGTVIMRFYGTENEVKKLLVRLAVEDKEEDEDCYDHGTELIEDVDATSDGYYAYGSYDTYHIDYTAKSFDAITFVKCKARMIAENIQWDTDGDQEVFDSLPQRVIIPNRFSKENYLDENGKFREAERNQMIEDISDWLSEEYEYCHDGFDLIEEEEI